MPLHFGSLTSSRYVYDNSGRRKCEKDQGRARKGQQARRTRSASFSRVLLIVFRDVANLWSDALRAYKGIVGTDLQPKFANVNEIIAFGTKEMNSFHKFRHNQKKVDKLRSLFMANIGYIETGAQQLVAAATPAFPPAAAIGTALTYMLSACKQVSADYDVGRMAHVNRTSICLASTGREAFICSREKA